MPRSNSDDGRARAMALMSCGRSLRRRPRTGLTASRLYGWVTQDRIDHGEIEGVYRTESRELVNAKRRIRRLKNEVEALQQANTLLGSSAQRSKRSTWRKTPLCMLGSPSRFAARCWACYGRVTTTTGGGEFRRSLGVADGSQC